MRWLMPLMSVLFYQVAVGETFRAATFGAACAVIPAQEKALGSKQVALNDESSGFLAFSTELFGEEVRVVYLCKDGLLFTENYYFPKRTSELSLRDFRRVYDDFNSRYGQALLDNTPWQSSVDPRTVEKNPVRYYVTWRKDGLRITIALMPQDEDPVTDRHVFIIVSTAAK